MRTIMMAAVALLAAAGPAAAQDWAWIGGNERMAQAIDTSSVRTAADGRQEARIVYALTATETWDPGDAVDYVRFDVLYDCAERTTERGISALYTLPAREGRTLPGTGERRTPSEGSILETAMLYVCDGAVEPLGRFESAEIFVRKIRAD